MEEQNSFDVPEDVKRLRRQGWRVTRKPPMLTQRQKQERAVAFRSKRKPKPTPLYEWMRARPPAYFERDGCANQALDDYLKEHGLTIRNGPNVPSFVRALFDEKRRRAVEDEKTRRGTDRQAASA